MDNKKQTNRGRKKTPFFIGEGLENKPVEKFIKFGCLIINKGLLYRNNRLALKYPCGACIKELPSQIISNNFAMLLKYIIDNGVVNQKLLNDLSSNENMLFHNVMAKAKLDDQLGLVNYKNAEIEKDMKRFELLKGIVLAGSNAPETLKELRLLIFKFMTNGLMKKNEGNQLLLELNAVI
jgi:hypothetical protein